jgi:hypothetical protein
MHSISSRLDGVLLVLMSAHRCSRGGGGWGFGRTGEKGTRSHPCHLGYRQPWCPQARRRLNTLVVHCGRPTVVADGAPARVPRTVPACVHTRTRAISRKHKHTCLFSSRGCVNTQITTTTARLRPRCSLRGSLFANQRRYHAWFTCFSLCWLGRRADARAWRGRVEQTKRTR